MNRFFSPRERLALRERPEEELNAGFFRCWSRKEAYVKARGMGLRLALDGFSVPLWRAGPGERVGPVRHPGSAETWDVIGMPEVQEHAVALCVEHIAETFRFFRMNEEAYV
jgi:4'-phosphopantetheinyl transferase